VRCSDLFPERSLLNRGECHIRGQGEVGPGERL
jgi:hypothetical protein